MQTKFFINLIAQKLFTSYNNNKIKHYFIIKKQSKQVKHNKIHNKYNMFANYYSVFNSNKQNMCFNTQCKHCKQCMYAQLAKAYKHITNNTYNNNLLLNYLQFYSNNYKYVNKYKIQTNLYYLTTKVQNCTCKLQQN